MTQRALLQWRPEADAAYLGNIFQMLEQAGLDEWLLQEKGIPLPIKDDGAGGDWNKAKEARLSWLTNEQIKAKYLANPNPDAISGWNVNRSIELYGLPMSRPERFGPFISQRFQRAAFQLWVEEIPGSPAPGTVIGVLAGDLLKEAGLVPPEGLNVADRPVVVAPTPAPAIRLTFHDAFDSAPAWSPDGRRIAFSSLRDGNTEIYLMNADGSGVTRLTYKDDFDSFPAWSPDGRRIAFHSYRDGNWDIYVMNADGLRRHPADLQQRWRRVPRLVTGRPAHRVRQRTRREMGDIRDGRLRRHPPHLQRCKRWWSGLVAGRPADRVRFRTGWKR